MKFMKNDSTPKYARYTKEDTRLIKQFAGKKTAAEIAIMLGRTRASVLNHASHYNISLRQIGQYASNAVLSDLQAQMVCALDDAGFTDTEINKACFPHVSRGCITNIASGSNRQVYINN